MLDLIGKREIVRFMVSQTIFCPGCKSVLDQKSAVALEGCDKSLVICCKCYDKLVSRGLKTDKFDVVDGRKLYAKEACTANKSECILNHHLNSKE
jgi:hypothetical protein